MIAAAVSVAAPTVVRQSHDPAVSVVEPDIEAAVIFLEMAALAHLGDDEVLVRFGVERDLRHRWCSSVG